MAKVNFTKENEARLKELAVIFLFLNTKFRGLMNSTMNIVQMLHELTINTLQSMYAQLKKEVSKIEDLDEWSMTDYQQKKKKDLELQKEFVYLLIGYKMYQAQLDEEKAKLTELKAKYKELKASTMSPTDQLAAIAKEIESLGDKVEDTPQPKADNTATQQQ